MSGAPAKRRNWLPFLTDPNIFLPHAHQCPKNSLYYRDIFPDLDLSPAHIAGSRTVGLHDPQCVDTAPEGRRMGCAHIAFRHRKRGVCRFRGQRGYNRRNYRSSDSKSYLGTVYCGLISMDHQPYGGRLDVVVDIYTSLSYGRARIPVVLATQ